jgi:hypothetical protein
MFAVGARRQRAKPKIGYTCITWGTFPRGAEASATLEAAVKVLRIGHGSARGGRRR